MQRLIVWINQLRLVHVVLIRYTQYCKKYILYMLKFVIPHIISLKIGLLCLWRPLSIGGGNRDPKGEGSTSGGVFLRGSSPYLCKETKDSKKNHEELWTIRPTCAVGFKRSTFLLLASTILALGHWYFLNIFNHS